MNENIDLSNVPGYEIFKPLVSGWVAKIESAKRAKKLWQEVADECSMFFSKSAAAMWSPEYEKKFWRGVKAPKFRISLNLAFEMVAVFGPSLMFDVPHRTVEPKRALDLPQDILQLIQNDPQMAMQMAQELARQDPMAMQSLMQMMQQAQMQQGQQQPGQPPQPPPNPGQMAMQMMMQSQQKSEATDKVVAMLMQNWLNYTPREQPKDGLIGQSELCIVDALVKGRGILWSKPYKMPQAQQVLTGSFRESPDNLLIDPDFKSIHDAKWIAVKRVDPHWALERRFQLPANSLKGRASLESSWTYGEKGSDHRQDGQTNDLVVWYEIFSKTGCGARMTGMHMPVKEHLEQVIGDYAYLAIAPSVPFPLNCSSRDLQVGGLEGTGLSDEEVRKKFEWPIPYWSDDRWPIEVLDFYPDPDSAWPIAPLSPGLGELKFLNFLIPWAANRIYNSSRDFWAIAGPHVEHYTKYLQEGLDQTIIPTPMMVDDVRKVITVLQQPEMRLDVWKIIELVSDLFAKRVGLTEMAYGRNEDGTQNRTAEETLAKSRAVGVRPDHMRKKVVGWQSSVACLEGFCARWFVEGKDVEPLMGPMGRLLWERFVMSTDVQLVARQMKYTVSAASIRRPDRDRDVANYQQVMQLFGPVMQQYGFATGNYGPYNAMMKQWGEYHDTRMDELYIPPPPPPQPTQPTAEDQIQLQLGQMELQGKQMDAETKQMDFQAKMQQAAADQLKSQLELKGLQAKLMLASAAEQQKVQTQAQQGQMDLQFKALDSQQSLQHQVVSNAMDIQHQAEMQQIKQRMAAKPKPANNSKA